MIRFQKINIAIHNHPPSMGKYVLAQIPPCDYFIMPQQHSISDSTRRNFCLWNLPHTITTHNRTDQINNFFNLTIFNFHIPYLEQRVPFRNVCPAPVELGENTPLPHHIFLETQGKRLLKYIRFFLKHRLLEAPSEMLWGICNRNVIGIARGEREAD